MSARPLVAALALGSALACSACGTGEPFIGHVDSVLAEDGSLHLLTRFRSGEDEGAHWTAYEFLYARPEGGKYVVESSTLGTDEGSADFETPYQLALGADGQALILAEVDGAFTAQAPSGSSWKTLPKGAGLSGAALAELEKPEKIGKAWTAGDQSVKFLYGQFLFTIRDGQIAEALDMGQPCSFADHCYFDPAGDTAGEAAIRVYDVGFQLRSLACGVNDPMTCEWGMVGLLGDDDLGGSSDPLHRAFFHTKDGTAVLVRPVERHGAGQDTIVASTLAGETTLFTGDVYQVGGGPLANGGFAAASLGHEKGLSLAIVGADGKVQQTIDLGTIDFGEEPIGIHARAASGGEEVHVVLRETHTSVAHFVVSLPGGSFTKESIAMK